MHMKSPSLVIAVVALSQVAVAGVRYTDASGRYMELGGRIQVQYHAESPNTGESTDELLFRRLRPYLQAGDAEWCSKIEWDMGGGNIDIRDAYVAYAGWQPATLIVGNYTTPYSRESITSANKQQLVELTLVGDHNYGVTDRQVGLHFEGRAGGGMSWAAAVVKAAVDPDNSRVDFDTVACLDRDEDWSEGNLAAIRLDCHPCGPMPYDQGDFDRRFRMTVGVAGYAWANDDDNLDPTRAKKDLDYAQGIELNAGLRGGGVSIDFEYNRIRAGLIEPGIAEGLYVDSETTLDVGAVEGGYMVLPGKLELVAAYEALDADGYDTTWTRASVGVNGFVRKHTIKVQATYRVGENVDGHAHRDADELFVQGQYAF